MSDLLVVFYILLFLVSFLYSTVGHGGASGYLALMAFFSFTPEVMRSSALILNIIVSGIAFFQYHRQQHFSWNLFWPFAITSVPAAFIGGLITVDAELYKKILAILLLFSVVRLLGISFGSKSFVIKKSILPALLIGAVIGLFSGMIGIGGGILLSPILLLLHWANMKQTAAVSALFIFVNSMAGFAGTLTQEFHISTLTLYMIFIAIAGGTLGSYFGSKKFESALLNKFLALVLIIASVKLLLV